MIVKTISCPNCMGPVTLSEGSNVAKCPYCGSSLSLEKEVNQSVHKIEYIDNARIRELELLHEAEERRRAEDLRERQAAEKREIIARRRFYFFIFVGLIYSVLTILLIERGVLDTNGNGILMFMLMMLLPFVIPLFYPYRYKKSNLNSFAIYWLLFFVLLFCLPVGGALIASFFF